jgi:uncharacterized protein YfeS
MKQEENYKISLAELSLRSKQIIAQQPVTTYAKALAQVQMLRQTSKIDQKLKKSKANR